MSKPKPGTARQYRQLTADEDAKLYGVRFSLEELFTGQGGRTQEEVLTGHIQVARWRIIGVFNTEKELYRKKLRKTDHCIVHANGSLEGLLRYVQSQLRRPFVQPKDLARRFWNLSPAHKTAICKIAVEQLLMAALWQMRNAPSCELWYHEGSKTWQIKQSCADEPWLARKRTRQTLNAVKGWYDNRTYHGRNGKQARRRDRANGNAYRSTGFANQVR